MFSLFSRAVEEPVLVDLEDKIAALKQQLEGYQEQQSMEDRIVELQAELTAQATLLKAGKLATETAERAVSVLKNNISEKEQEAKNIDEDIKHMMKMTKESDALAMQKFELGETAKTAEAIAKVKDDYRDSMEKVLQKQIDDGKALVAQVLEILPTASLKMKASV